MFTLPRDLPPRTDSQSFPQVQRVAVLPFYNQSDNPTVDTEVVAEKYYAALQAIPGFEVLPVGVTKTQWLIYSQQHGDPVTW